MKLLHLGEMLLRVVVKHHFHAVVNGQLQADVVSGTKVRVYVINRSG